MLLLILQVALLVFIACGVGAIVTVYVVRRRKVGYRHEPNPYLGTLGQMGVVPPTPLPEWANWPQAQDSDDPDELPPAGWTRPS